MYIYIRIRRSPTPLKISKKGFFVLQNQLLNLLRTSIDNFSNAYRTFISSYDIRFAHRQLRWTPFDLPEAPVLLDFSNSSHIGTILSKFRNYPFGSTERHIFTNV